MVRAATGDERRVRLSKERVLSAAVALADRDGVESLTMRKLADELGAGAMSLYHHVPNKERLLDGMVDAVFEEVELPSTDVDWKTAMRRRALSTRAVLARHPWSVGLLESRLHPGPASYRLHNAVLGALREGGFSVEMAVHAYSVQDAYIYGFALQEKSLPFEGAEESAEVAETMMTEMLREVPADEYPYLVEVVGGFVATSGYDFAEEFLFGLDLILDGLDRLRDAPGTA
jgi:AcrR family transcriptional regulator